MSEYSEDELVEQSAIDVFTKDLRYEHLNCYEEKFPETLGRETKSNVVLVNRLTAAIEKLNDNLSEDAKKEAVAQLLQDRSRLSLVKANQEVYKLIKDGVKVKTKSKKGGYEYRTIKVIDFNNSENNDLYALVTCFRNMARVPLVMKTSLNESGKAMIDSPIQAIEFLLNTSLDVLYINNFRLEKKY